MTVAFKSVVLDVDSTVSGMEGIDFLAARRGPEVAQKIAQLTADAMQGKIPLESVYGRRLAEIRPTRQDIDALGKAYIESIAPGCADAIRRMQAAGVNVVLVSGGIRQGIAPMAEKLGIDFNDLHAVDVWFDDKGGYQDFDSDSPLATTTGKESIVRKLELDHPILAMGDGATDVYMKSAVDKFVAFVGFARRENVVAKADAVVSTFKELESLAIGHG